MKRRNLGREGRGRRARRQKSKRTNVKKRETKRFESRPPIPYHLSLSRSQALEADNLDLFKAPGASRSRYEARCGRTTVPHQPRWKKKQAKTMSLVGTTTPLCCVCFETLGAKGGPCTLPCGKRRRDKKKERAHLEREKRKKALADPRQRPRSFFSPSFFFFQPQTFSPPNKQDTT